ncbi:conserved Plasmodium protein, unknown function [Plasmodium chabaudi adami]|uniref:Uncharacterized protein n=1 Tax=Plasmodium chabaudi adami TaxID=5826 RepID=A0A1C6XRU7_PLACE|nr:conserved Plasmodium protein, unknown function [Plasmodium chabaudi adami]
MNKLNTKNKNTVETIPKEDIIILIKKCYEDKLIYGHVKWKDLNKKDFKKKYSTNTLKYLWRTIYRKFGNYKTEYSALIKKIEDNVKEIKIEDKKRKKKQEAPISPKSPVSVSNISLLRNFTRVNSLFFKCCSNYYSPINGNLKESPINLLFFNGKYVSKEKKKIAEKNKKEINYIKENIKDIKRRSEFLDYYFLVISLIHKNKKYTLLKKMEELYYENKIIKCCNNTNIIYNIYILNILKKINELSLISSNNLKNISTKSLENKFGSSKFIDTKNCLTIEVNEQTYQFNKSHIDYKIFYNLFKKNININNNKTICFFLPLPKKPNYLTFKNNTFYYFDNPIYLTNNLDKDVYNYVYIFHKYFLSFMFWTFYLKYNGIEKMKTLFNAELEQLHSSIHMLDIKKDDNFYEKKKKNIKYNNETYTDPFDFNTNTLASLCLAIIKKYLILKKKIDIDYFQVIKILNMALHPIFRKKILRHYLFTLRTVQRVLTKLRLVSAKKGIKNIDKHNRIIR